MSDPASNFPVRNRRSTLQAGRLTRRVLMVLAGAAVAAASLVTTATGVATQAQTGLTLTDSIQPTAQNDLDCNGWSPTYKPVSAAFKMRCVDPAHAGAGEYGSRAYDNGHYVGHDEPSVRFESTAHGSGNTMTYFMQLSVDPSGTPSTSPTSPIKTDYAELSPAPWFGLAICDPNSWPGESVGGVVQQASCTPDSDANAPTYSNQTFTGGGSAFMELQFYPPGYTPFIDSPSCDATRWCAALNIDSLTEKCASGSANCGNPNPSCFEPVNFAFLTRDGVPTGPPNPQQADADTQTPNSDTLYMNPGDTVAVHIFETPNGLETRVDDYTTGQSGFMVASASNGFATTDPNTCAGTPFNFHASFDTATYNPPTQDNTTSWSALEGGVLMEDEIGHFEPCTSVSNPFTANFPSGFSDPNTNQVCTSAFEADESRVGGSTTGEGPCVGSTCTGATTEGNTACNTNVSTLCEFSDAICIPSGTRPITVDGHSQTAAWPIAGCEANWFQNGDLDYDGTDYQADWPDGDTTHHPTSFKYLGPFDAAGNEYPDLQFETDGPGSESGCNTTSGAGCAVPPAGAAFYPYWTINNVGGSQNLTGLTLPSAATPCVWNFGNTISGVSTDTFGGDAEYGSPDLTHFAGTLISAQMANPTDGGSNGAAPPVTCTALTQRQVVPSPAYSFDQLDGYGSVHALAQTSSIAATSSATMFNFVIARSLVLFHDGSGRGYVLDGWGGIHPIGGAPAVTGGPYWKDWDIARTIVLMPDDSGGYVLDGQGGIHPFGVGSSAAPPLPTGYATWKGWDIARGLVVLPDGTGGFTLDGWGGVHPFAIGSHPIPTVNSSDYFYGFDIARSIVLTPDGAGGFFLDGFGGIHAFAVGSHAVPSFGAITGYFRGFDIARSIALLPGISDPYYSGWVLDGWGGIHPFGTAPGVVAGGYTPGRDINRTLLGQ